MSSDARLIAFSFACRHMAQHDGQELLGPLFDSGTGEPSPVLEQAADLFEKSLIGEGLPNFWMETPLAGKAGFDLHVYFDRNQLPQDASFTEGTGFGYQGLFDWYIKEETGGLGLGFAHDIRDGASGAPAVYMNVNNAPLDDTDGFFAAAGRPQAARQYHALAEALPRSWDVWYLGLFGRQPHASVRAGSLVQPRAQMAYARDPKSLEADLRNAGFDALTSQMLDQLQQLAQLPFGMEIQLDMQGTGEVGNVLSASLTLGVHGPQATRALFDNSGSCKHEGQHHNRHGVGARLLDLLENWNVADERCRLIPNLAFARLISVPSAANADATMVIACTPVFIKLKWEGGALRPAKVYYQFSLTCR